MIDVAVWFAHWPEVAMRLREELGVPLKNLMAPRATYWLPPGPLRERQFRELGTA